MSAPQPSDRAIALAAQPNRLIQYLASSISRTFALHAPLYICAVVFFAATAVLLSRYRLSLPLSGSYFFLEMVGECLLLWIGVIAAIDVYRLWRAKHQGSVFAAVGQNMLARFVAGERPGNSFHALATLTPMMIVFAAVKTDIPAIAPFSWDATFSHWDRILGMGRMPWEILQPILGFPLVTIGLNLAYDAWFAVMFAVLLWQGFSPRTDTARLQYLLAFAFAWFFGGSILAIVFSSAGPCFYHHLYPGVSPYAAQLAYLREIGPDRVWSLWVQDELWQNYKTGIGEISGISAMPSMHVTVAVLLALLGWRIRRGLGIALTAYAALVAIGSVHLAWHYAVDGIAGLAIAIVCWAFAGLVVRLRLAQWG